MSKRFAWAKNLPKADNDTGTPASKPALQPAQPAPISVPPNSQQAEQPAEQARKPRERLLDRRDGRAKPAPEFIEGLVRGGKRSNQWGRSNSELSPGDWIGARLPQGYNTKLKQMAVAHDLHAWQVLTEGIDLFEATHGAAPRHRIKP